MIWLLRHALTVEVVVTVMTGDGNSDQHSDDDRIWMIMILMMMFLAFCYRTHGNQ